jgi:hypothetical protein
VVWREPDSKRSRPNSWFSILGSPSSHGGRLRRGKEARPENPDASFCRKRLEAEPGADREDAAGQS